MIAGTPLSGPGAHVFAWLEARFGEVPVTPALRACLPEAPDPTTALARRQVPPPGGHVHASGRAPLARHLRRLGRRGRTLCGDRLEVPTLANAEEAAEWAWSAPSPDAVRDRVAHLPFDLACEVARWPR